MEGRGTLFREIHKNTWLKRVIADNRKIPVGIKVDFFFHLSRSFPFFYSVHIGFIVNNVRVRHIRFYDLVCVVVCDVRHCNYEI